MPEDHDHLRPNEIQGLLQKLGEQAEHAAKPKDEVLLTVQAGQRRKTRNLLIALLVGVAIFLVLFYFAYQKYMSQFI